jgi:hypothetical protein
MTGNNRFGSGASLKGVLVLSVVLSLGSIGACIALNRPADAGRGGAIAVAISFGMLFLSRGRGAQTFDTLYDGLPTLRTELEALTASDPKPEASAAQIKRLATALKTWLTIDAQATSRQNIFLAISSVVGTLAWGFGDWAAEAVLKLIG